VADGTPYNFLASYSDCAASTTIQGTIKGQRTQHVGDSRASYRFAVFNISSNKGTDGKHDIYYHEYILHDHILGGVATGIVGLQNAYPHDFSTTFYLESTFDFLSNIYSETLVAPYFGRKIFKPDNCDHPG